MQRRVENDRPLDSAHAQPWLRHEITAVNVADMAGERMLTLGHVRWLTTTDSFYVEISSTITASAVRVRPAGPAQLSAPC